MLMQRSASMLMRGKGSQALCYFIFLLPEENAAKKAGVIEIFHCFLSFAKSFFNNFNRFLIPLY
jgi:hypothetical protein